ncbi:MAG TPA: Smr/MutS family protein [Alphaproteobacteria bacterium]
MRNREARPVQPTAEERELFRAVLRDVQPLRARGRHVRDRAADIAAAGATDRPAAAVGKGERHPGGGQPVAKPAAARPEPNPGLDRRTAMRLRRGDIPIERRLDLHGMTQADAHAALDRFVRRAWADGKRMLLIITGKGSVIAGGGVLRRYVPGWLTAGEHAARVLRIETARPQHGGSGAYYVLLRRNRGAS